MLDKSRAEKLIRGAEEEQEKVTLNLLQKLDRINREKLILTKDLEAQKEEVFQKLQKSQKMNFVGYSVDPNNTTTTHPAGTTTSSMSPRSHRNSVPSPLQLSQFNGVAKLQAAIVQRNQLCGSDAGSPPASPERLQYSLSRLNASASHLKDPRLGLETTTRTSPTIGKPTLLIDYLAHSLEEAQAMEGKVYALEEWSKEVYFLAEKFRTEVIELRNRVSNVMKERKVIKLLN